ncbi:putative secreted protein [Streptomyces davaonensis JCM 4913]|uniref:Putative secreted protein n=1 Tax=Streptomyces davaonensis (strain DSM 101723 / JCM 4913 / KCC S-0913 / 768) TaxID=1214101 RepID=K4RB09_STRDJ|nr:tyrosinase family oxidase copper chaperone [Streptomyces davaonensis]CCK29974.1 putative secreted protein [Streptomyces davaonensis JCM 4913]
MVVGVGGMAVGTEPGTQGKARTGPVRGGRRDLLRGLLVAAGALALAPVVAASRPGAVQAEDKPGELAFDETYRGRHLRGIRTSDVRGGAPQWYVTVDGVPLHLMRRADGSWLSMIDHYASYATPLDAARGAVDELGPGQRLRDTGTDTREHHGVHA